MVTSVSIVRFIWISTSHVSFNMIAQGNGERRESPEGSHSSGFWKVYLLGEGAVRVRSQGAFPLRAGVPFPSRSPFVLLSPPHLLLLFIVYLPNEGGGVDCGLIDSYKPLQSGQRAVGFGFKSVLNVRLWSCFYQVKLLLILRKLSKLKGLGCVYHWVLTWHKNGHPPIEKALPSAFSDL